MERRISLFRRLQAAGLAALMATAISAVAVTPQQQAAKADGDAFANQLDATARNVASNPGNNLPQYTDQPPQLQYNDPAALQNAASTAIANDPNGQFLLDSATQRPRFVIDPNTDPLVNRANNVTSNPTDAIGMIDQNYAGCETINNFGDCIPTFSEQVCDEYVGRLRSTCRIRRTLARTVKTYCPDDNRPLDVSLSWVVNGQRYSVSIVSQCDSRAEPDQQGIVNLVITLDMRKRTGKQTCYTRFSVNAGPQYIICGPELVPPPDPNDDGYSLSAYLSIKPAIELVPQCSGDTCTMSVRIGFMYRYLRDRLLYIFGIGGCPLLGTSQSAWNVGGTYFQPLLTRDRSAIGFDDECGFASIVPKRYTFPRPVGKTIEIPATEENGCLEYEERVASGECTPDYGSQRCHSSPFIRLPGYFFGLTTIFDRNTCLDWEESYWCAAAPSNNNCQPLRDQGCEQISSSCLARFSDGECSVAQEVMRCPDNNCTATPQLVCGNQAFCIDGSCVDQTPEPNPGFARAAALMGALEEVGKEFDPDSLTLFTGNQYFCGITLGSRGYNCCDFGGILRGALSDCNTQERRLAQLASAGRCHYVGNYCDVSLFNLGDSACITRKYGYCCYSSKLARIIVEAAHDQLGISWGTAAEPNCVGITPDQLAALDFSRINFSPFYGDIVANAPDPAAIQQTIQQQINDFYNRAPPPR